MVKRKQGELFYTRSGIGRNGISPKAAAKTLALMSGGGRMSDKQKEIERLEAEKAEMIRKEKHRRESEEVSIEKQNRHVRKVAALDNRIDALREER